ncbi:unnamed protein product [Caenorhabditis bovis]|uniref:alpha-1,2-Mannosidase n=1 Tax=Caenorhabditis bovis TaxID=2654633 RepID=A0A8S1F2D7_9PELO|nr:unnamed protein product [Caenorhabditis bovis]
MNEFSIFQINRHVVFNLPITQFIFVFHCFSFLTAANPNRNLFTLTDEEIKYSTFSEKNREYAKTKSKEMFYFGWDNYMKYAFPADELDPIHCRGRGADHSNPDNLNINDVLGDYSLTLIDTLDSLVVFGDTQGFKTAVNLVIKHVSFERNTTVQVFESTIRVMGGLLSAHMIASDSSNKFGSFYMKNYNGELLALAHDLAKRLLPAFENTGTGIPYCRVNLMKGVLPGTVNDTCTSGAGTLVLEFGVLSRLLGDEKYEKLARKVIKKLWELRNAQTGLHGNLLNIHTGEWVGHLSGIGAGIDSFYEYLLKSYIMFGQESDLQMFNESFARIGEYMRRGRSSCLSSEGEPPIYVNVDARDGSTTNYWVDSLQASFSGVLVLAGYIDEAVCHHAFYYAIWKKFGVLPERYNWRLQAPDVNFYPLRPEFVESTYFLYTASKNPFYLHVGMEIMESLDRITRVKCGFATVHDVQDGSLEDRMESFFLAETMKYLYLLFDHDNPVNKHQERILFNTEGHFYPINHKLRQPAPKTSFDREDYANLLYANDRNIPLNVANSSCSTLPEILPGVPPLQHAQMKQIFDIVGVDSHIWK